MTFEHLSSLTCSTSQTILGTFHKNHKKIFLQLAYNAHKISLPTGAINIFFVVSFSDEFLAICIVIEKLLSLLFATT